MKYVRTRIETQFSGVQCSMPRNLQSLQIRVDKPVPCVVNRSILSGGETETLVITHRCGQYYLDPVEDPALKTTPRTDDFTYEVQKLLRPGADEDEKTAAQRVAQAVVVEVEKSLESFQFRCVVTNPTLSILSHILPDVKVVYDPETTSFTVQWPMTCNDVGTRLCSILESVLSWTGDQERSGLVPGADTCCTGCMDDCF